jgi:hypothetical protein
VPVVGGHNDDAWTKVPRWGLLGYALLLASVLPVTNDDRAMTAVWLLLPTVIGIGVVVSVATQAGRDWGWRPYALTVPLSILVLAGGLALLRQADPALEEGPPTAAPRPVSQVGGLQVVSALSVRDETPPPSTFRLTAPPSDGPWSRFQNHEIRAAVDDAAATAVATYGIEDVAAGYYEHRSLPGTGILYVGLNGAVGPSPEAVGRAELGGADEQIEAFPARGSAWLGCGAQVAGDRSRMSCAWVTADRALLLRWDDDSVTAARAAALTRSFRTFAAS